MDRTSLKSKVFVGDSPSRNVIPRNWAFYLCLATFCAGILITNCYFLRLTYRIVTVPEANITGTDNKREDFGDEDSKLKDVSFETSNSTEEVSKVRHAIEKLAKKVVGIERDLAAAMKTKKYLLKGSPVLLSPKVVESNSSRKYLMVLGINTGFSSQSRRESLRTTWMPQGEKRRKLEEQMGIIIRFVIGHSNPTSGGILEKAIEDEDRKHGDFLRLDLVDSDENLSAKTKKFFATAVAMWDADFYVKVDDDVHVNIGALARTLISHYNKPRLYIGCMKSDPVLFKKGARNYEPNHWKFGSQGNNYLRHASGQIYAISKELALYVHKNQDILHKYANEDVSVGTWFIGLDVDHVDNRRLCCSTPSDCEWRDLLGFTCVATYDRNCSGICNTSKRMKEIHKACSEDQRVLRGKIV